MMGKAREVMLQRVSAAYDRADRAKTPQKAAEWREYAEAIKMRWDDAMLAARGGK